MSESIKTQITGCAPKPCPELTRCIVESPKPTATEISGGAIETPIQNHDGALPHNCERPANWPAYPIK